MRRNFLLIICILCVCFACSCNNSEWGSNKLISDNENTSDFEIEELDYIDENIAKSCEPMHATYIVKQKSELAVIYEIKCSEQVINIMVEKIGDDSFNYFITIENDNIKLSDCPSVTEDQINLLLCFVNCFCSAEINESTVISFISDKSNEQELSFEDERIVEKTYDYKGLNFSYTVKCKNDIFAKDCKESDYVNEILTICIFE